ncbi:hypothetical protein B0A49_08003 [Cryomyces minteri]|uniref:Zn(2)-C6 fungal-type domain-containing protein n=1 Tax=Cryomyces minteri TaxID=331657 RepID=A0A4V5NG74_9PEZI|nr:hypothetical protein B0A49_08003 [Cryomyces minteri]
MDVERSEPEGADSVARAAVKACDACRARKIKCDRKAPCSSCLSSHGHCKTSPRQPEKKKRILISAGYEKEVKGVNERLASLEKTIHTLVASPRSPANTDDQFQRTNTVRSPRTLEDDHNVPFEGASSFTAHSKQVSQAFRSAATSAGLPSELISTSGLGRDRFNDETKGPVGDLYELPPMSLVLKTLRAAKTNPKRYFPGLSDLNITSMTDMCQKVYFPTEDCSTAFVTVVNSGLWAMFNNFGERDLHHFGLDELEFERARALCKRNLDDAARCTPLLLEHSYRQIQALLLLSLFLLETSRPSLALSFASAGARLCQDAGYHCLTFDSSESQAQQKIITFWFVFLMDRGLSLNFGRSPSLQNYDVTASRPTLVEAQGDRGLFFCSVGVELAYLQGDVYEQLYSGRAQSESADVKAQRARVLADRMIRLRHQLLSFETSDDISAMDMIEGTALVLQSHLALIYRAIRSTRGDSPLHFCDECVTASRAAIEGYNAAWEKYRTREDTAWKTVINWTYLFSPFTPFIVLFGTVVAFKSEADLKLMEVSVETLKSAAQYSSGVAKLHNACETFFNLAKAYMAQTIKKGESYEGPLHQQPATEAFDPTSLYGQDWDAMLDDWDLGLGGENAREMSSFLTGSFFSWPNMP